MQVHLLVAIKLTLSWPQGYTPAELMVNPYDRISAFRNRKTRRKLVSLEDLAIIRKKRAAEKEEKARLAKVALEQEEAEKAEAARIAAERRAIEEAVSIFPSLMIIYSSFTPDGIST